MANILGVKTVKAAPKAALADARIATPGLDLYATIDAMIKNLFTLKDTAREEIERQMVDQFYSNKGVNYKAEDTASTATLMWTKRNSRSSLSDIELEMLAGTGISTEVVEDRPETYIINPTYAENVTMMKKAQEALKKAGLPADILMYQESTKKTVTTENSKTELMKLNDEETIKKLIPIVGTLMVKVSSAPETDVSLKQVGEMMGVELVTKAEAEAMAAELVKATQGVTALSKGARK